MKTAHLLRKNQSKSQSKTVYWETLIENNEVLKRAGCASVVYQDRYILIFGGRTKSRFFLDCFSLDTQTGTLSPLSKHDQASGGHPHASPRAHHSVTLIDDTAWIIGGGDDTNNVVEDSIICFNIPKREWFIPDMTGDTDLLKRTAHGACIHPTNPASILIFAGYTQNKDDCIWLHDLVLVNTKQNNLISTVKPKGALPPPRAYHSFTAMGHFCISLFGRSMSSALISSKESPPIYDALKNKWILTHKVGGIAPVARASHRVCAVHDGVLVFGGAPAQSDHPRLSDLCLLRVDGAQSFSRGRSKRSTSADVPKLEWISYNAPPIDDNDDDDNDIGTSKRKQRWPQGRASHIAEYIKGHAYIVAGYGDKKEYASNAWKATLEFDSHDVEEGTKTHGSKKRTREEQEIEIEQEIEEEEQEIEEHQHQERENRPLILQETDGGSDEVVLIHDTPASTTATTNAADDDGSQWRSLKKKRMKDIQQQSEYTATLAKKNRSTIDDGANAAKKQKSSKSMLVAASHPAGAALAAALKANVGVNTPAAASLQAPAATATAQLTRVAQLERRLYDINMILDRQRATEAQLLKEKDQAIADRDAFKRELQETDSKWQQAAADCEKWKLVAEENSSKAARAEQLSRAEIQSMATEKEREVRDAHAELKREKEGRLSSEAEKSRLFRQVQDTQASLEEERVNGERLRNQHALLLEQNTTMQQQLMSANSALNARQLELDATKAELRALVKDSDDKKRQLEHDLKVTKEMLDMSQLAASKAQRLNTSLENELRMSEDELDRLKNRFKREDDSRKHLEEKIKKYEGEVEKLELIQTRLTKEVAIEKAKNERNFSVMKDVVQNWNSSF